MKKTDRVVREQLLSLLHGGNAHMTFDEALAAFPPEYINKKPGEINYTFWHLLEHMKIAQWDILEFIRNPDHVTPDWPDGFWPPKTKKADKKEWKKTISSYKKDLKSIEQFVQDSETDLFAPIPHAKKYTIFREILLVADHNAYHISELITLRRVMGIGPPGAW
jgi:hypothetical protein